MKTRSPLYRTPSILIALLSSVTVSIALAHGASDRGLGDGATIDAAGRVYVTAHGEEDGIDVFSSKGEPLGFIPTPYPVISLSFGGPGKKTLYTVAETGKSPAQAAKILSINMIAAGYPGRAK